MGIFDLSPIEYQNFLFVLLRVGAMIMFIPILGSAQIPGRIKIGFILFISIAVFPMVRATPMHDPKGLFDLAVSLFSEITIGLAIATATTAMILIFHFSIGILLASKRFSLQPLLKCVPVYALIISLIFVYYEIPSPKFLENATFLIGYSAIFLVLMSLGIALSQLKVFSFSETLIYSLTRVLIGPIVGFGFVKFFDLSGVEAGVMFIQASMPSAVLTFLVGKIYSPKKISDSIASTVALSTFLSFFTLVVVVFISLKYFN